MRLDPQSAPVRTRAVDAHGIQRGGGRKVEPDDAPRSLAGKRVEIGAVPDAVVELAPDALAGVFAANVVANIAANFVANIVDLFPGDYRMTIKVFKCSGFSVTLSK